MSRLVSVVFWVSLLLGQCVRSQGLGGLGEGIDGILGGFGVQFLKILLEFLVYIKSFSTRLNDLLMPSFVG